MTSIPDIDTATIDELKKLRDQQEVLEGRLAKMEEKKDSVSPPVYDRVRSDYRDRLRELDEEARPLEEAARGEWARLREVFQRIQELQAEARLEREELEFRHELGEFGEDEFDQQVESVEKRLEEHEDEIEQMETLRKGFVEAFGSEERLETGPGSQGVKTDAAPPPVPAEAEEPEELVRASETRPSDAVAGEREAAGEVARPSESMEGLPPAPGVPPPPAPVAEGEDDEGHEEEGWAAPDEATALGPIPGETEPTDLPLHDEPDAGATRVMSTAAPVSEEGADVTRILRKPRLETLEGEDVGQSFVLGALPVTIGRSSDNTIHLLEEAVSRHHAELIPGPDGFLLRDLGSENGTFVNGKRKKEHFLQDGDVVQIGLRKMVFREA